MRMRGVDMESLFTETGLRNFISRRKFRLYLQPQIFTKTGRVTGAEASIRLKTKKRIIQIPERVFNGVKARGVFYLRELYLLCLVCRQLTEWQLCALEPVEIAVRFSACTMEREDIIEEVERIINEYPGALSWLRIHISDTAQVKNWGLFRNNCRKLSCLGIGLSIDGYGSQMTDNSLLLEPWFDEVGIDETLTEKIESRTMDFLVVKVILDMCRQEGKQAVAKNIDHEEQYVTLKRMGCERVEGEYTGLSMAADLFERTYLERTAAVNII